MMKKEMQKKRSRERLEDPLFREATEDVIPISDDRVEPFRRHRRPRPLSVHHRRYLEFDDELSDFLSESEIETAEELYFARPGVQHRLMRDLARGRLEIGETLDLHGLNATHARDVRSIIPRLFRSRMPKWNPSGRLLRRCSGVCSRAAAADVCGTALPDHLAGV